MGKAKNSCRYNDNGWCRLYGNRCSSPKKQEECDGYETSGLDKERTIERDKARKEKRKRERE